MNDNKKGSFWPSYVDLMTNLFAVTLVLFVVTFKLFKIREDELVAKAEELERLKSINESIENIDKDYFDYNVEFKKHILNIDVKYPTGKFFIDDIMDASAKNKLIKAGRKIVETIQRLNEDPQKAANVKYLVVIEGQASADNYYINDYFNNDVLSYLRAQKLKEFWLKDNHLRFDQLGNCELIVSGSGEGGVPRVDSEETRNQRFLVHIVPVIGKKEKSR